MTQTIELIARNIRRLREIKKFSQKEVAVNSNIPQGSIAV